MPTQTASINFAFTAQGQALASQALSGKTQITFTKAVSSSTSHYGDTASQSAQLTDLDNKQQTVNITEVDAIDGDPNSVKIPIIFNKKDVDTDYQLLTIGLYAKPTDGDEVLYSVCGLQDPIYMHKTTYDATYRIDLIVIVGTSANVTLKVDPAGLVSNADLTAALKDYPSKEEMNAAIQAIPQPDTSDWQKHKLTADDGSAKLVIASGDDVNAKINAVIGTKDVGTISIDINAKNNTAGHSLYGTYANSFDGVLNAFVHTSDGVQWMIGANGKDTPIWTQLPSAAGLDAKADDTKVVHRNPDTGTATDKTDFNTDDLTVNKNPVVPIVMVADEATAKSKSAADPSTIYLYPES